MLHEFYLNFKKMIQRSTHCGSAVTNLNSIHENMGSIPSLAQWLRIWRCCVLWHRLQTRFRPHMAVAVAVAQAASCSYDLTPSLGISICHSCSPEKEKKKKKKDIEKNVKPLLSSGLYKNRWLARLDTWVVVILTSILD